MTNTLPIAKNSIERFITEARVCAERKLGFAAMATAFAVIMAVSEAVYRHTKAATGTSRIDDKKLFKEFAPHITDKSWLVLRPPLSALSDQDIATELFHVRNGLAHQLSLPSYVGMINTKSEAREFFANHSDMKHAISVTEFVDAVDIAVQDIIKKYPAAEVDPNPKGGPRGPAARVLLSNTSASKPT